MYSDSMAINRKKNKKNNFSLKFCVKYQLTNPRNSAFIKEGKIKGKDRNHTKPSFSTVKVKEKYGDQQR